MAINVLAARPGNVLLALPTLNVDGVPLTELGLTTSNALRVYEYDAQIRSWTPGPGIKPITSIIPGRAYIIFSKIDLDLSQWFAPPFPSNAETNFLQFDNYYL